MGQPKEGVVLWDGRPMIEHVIDALQAVCRQIVIVGACTGWTPEPPIIGLADRHVGLGPLGGIETLLASGLDGGYLVVGCDQPILTPQILGLLTNPSEPDSPCFLRTEYGVDLDPLPGYFPVTWRSVARAALEHGQRSVRDAVRSAHATWVTLPDQWQRQIDSLNTRAEVVGVAASASRTAAR
jgi:molybdopterin-guanine dinucleotide biosynthesis protein A